MSKKDLIKALLGGLAFGLLVFVFIQIFLFFVDTEFETEEVLKPEIKIEITTPEPILVEKKERESDVAMVTFKYEIRIQNQYDDELLEHVETMDEVLRYLNEYTRFHDDLYVYDTKTRDLILDVKTYRQVMQELLTKEELLIKAAENPNSFSDEEIFELLVD
tara:strand:+ start:3669 stop:4154 length:486 start_codon:yes stop_codon:yes gene_type:complete